MVEQSRNVCVISVLNNLEIWLLNSHKCLHILTKYLILYGQVLSDRQQVGFGVLRIGIRYKFRCLKENYVVSL